MQEAVVVQPIQELRAQVAQEVGVMAVMQALAFQEQLILAAVEAVVITVH
jgi:hypothetical protein